MTIAKTGTKEHRSTRGRTVACAAVMAVLLLAGIALAGCTPSTPKAETGAAKPLATVTDDASRTVTIQKRPERIISLAPANTEILAAINALDRVVGVTTWDDYPAEVKDLPKVGDFVNPNMEAISAAKPDLILVTGGVQAEQLSRLEKTGAAVVVIDPKTLEGVFRDIRLVGQVVDSQPRAIVLERAMRKRLESVTDRTGSVAPVTCFVEIGWNPLFTTGPDTLLNDMVKAAGGKNIVTESGYVSYSVEQLVKQQPQVYTGTASSIGAPLDVAKRPGFESLQAVKDFKVYSLDDNLVSRPGPRIVDGVEQIAKSLHPDLFK